MADAVRLLEPFGELMKLPPARTQGWHGSLFGHLVPQLEEQHPVVVAAVTGGTNTGKSTLFNYLVGERISRTERYATKTKHPVCVLPQGMSGRWNLEKWFGDFHLQPWVSEDDAALASNEDRLIVREDPSGRQSQRLILLDTPDVDGVLVENWQRAERIRNAADVLICTLTEQKYNDDAVVRFFREAARSDKTLIVAFNFIEHWPEDRTLCLGWLAAFEQQTGVSPHYVYAVEKDRAAAESNRLRIHPLSSGANELRSDLGDLKFAEIKIRSFQGSLRHVLDREHGLPAYLAQLSGRADEYLAARETLQQEISVRGVELPRLPTHLVWEPVWDWLESRRTRFDRAVHGFYYAVGRVITWPFRADENELEQTFRKQEWASYSRAIQKVLDQMRLLRKQGSEIAKEAVGEALGGLEQETLFQELERTYQQLPLMSADYRQFVRAQLDQFAEDNPRLVKWISYGLIATAVARPALTIGLMALPAGDLVAHLGSHSALAAAQHGATEAAAQHTAATIGLEAAAAVTADVTVQGGSTLALSQLLAKIFGHYYEARAGQLTELLNQRITGPVLARLTTLAEVAGSDPLGQAQKLIGELQREVG